MALNSLKQRKFEFFLIISYIISGIFVGSIIRNFIFLSISNIWVSLLFLSPLILSSIAAFSHKKKKKLNIPLILCSLFWVNASLSQLFDDDTSQKDILFFAYLLMMLISLSHLIFLVYLTLRNRSEGRLVL